MHNFDKQVDLIRSSDLFDDDWYRRKYKEVIRSGMSPAEHYVFLGASLGYSPSASFDAADYVRRNPDALALGTNPLLHFEARSGSLPRSTSSAGSTKPVLNGSAETSTKSAREAAVRGEWEKAKGAWEHVLNLRVEPYLGLSKAYAEMGDWVRAETAIRDGLSGAPNSAALLFEYCRLAYVRRHWVEAVARWERATDAGGERPRGLQASICEALIHVGDVNGARALAEEGVAHSPRSGLLWRALALAADAQGDWEAASQYWVQGAELRQGPDQIRFFVSAAKSLIKGGDSVGAERLCTQQLAVHPENVDLLLLNAEIALEQGAWPIVLERWKRVEAQEPSRCGQMPTNWIYRLGLNKTIEETQAMGPSQSQGIAYVTLAALFSAVNHVKAASFARKARRFYPLQAVERICQLLIQNGRQSASIWWLRRLIDKYDSPTSYTLLIEALIESSRFDEAEGVVGEYVERFGKDSLWLRAQTEIAHRRNDYAVLADLLSASLKVRLPRAKGVSSLRWLYRIIQVHDRPETFLPPEINDLVVRVSAIYDGRVVARSLANLLDARAGEVTHSEYLELIETGGDLDLGTRAEIARFFLQRRSWEPLEKLMAGATFENFDPTKPSAAWTFARFKADFLMGRGRKHEAEGVIVEFLNLMKDSGNDQYVLSILDSIMLRLPTCEDIVVRLEAAARRLEHSGVARALADWRTLYCLEFDNSMPPAVEGGRCFIVGNAPSLATLPLHLLEGETLFCVNRGLRSMELGLPCPDYLVIGDALVYKSHWQELYADTRLVKQAFIGSNCLWRGKVIDDAIPYGSSGLKLSLAPFAHGRWTLNRGETVVIVAAQIAHLLGYKEIYIIGVDLDYDGPTTHFYGGGAKERERLANFRPGGTGAEAVNVAFANLQEAIHASGARLFNASPSGKLESLPRVNFEELLGERSYEATSQHGSEEMG